MDIRIILVPLIIFPLGLVTFLIAQQAWRTQRQSLDARGWSRTTGRVIQSGVEETQMNRRSSVSVENYRFVTRYVPAVVYEYQVEGTVYRSTRLQLGYVVASSESSSAQRQADRYPLGSEVNVYYQPANHAESTLSLKAGWGTGVMWGIALFMLLVTLFTAALIVSLTP